MTGYFYCAIALMVIFFVYELVRLYAGKTFTKKAKQKRIEFELSLPNDLKEFIRKKKREGIVFSICFLILFVIGAVFILLHAERMGDERLIFVTVAYLVVAIYISYVTEIPKKYIQSSFCGEVMEVNVDSTIKRDMDAKVHFLSEHTIVLKVKESEDVISSQPIATVRNSSVSLIGKYNKGDKVVHLYGSKETVVLPTEKDTFVACPICGAENSKELTKCRICAHSLIHSFLKEEDSYKDIGDYSSWN